jgi:regulator of protease activity HflC (stomatin/prohibitin superfamily)
MIMKRVVVRKHERGLLLRDGDFDRILRPGTYWLYEGLDTMAVELFSLEQPAFTHRLADYLMAKEPAVVAAEFVHVALGESQVGLRTENGVLVEILPPASRRLYWKHGLIEVAVEKIDLGISPEVPAGLLSRLVQAEGQPGALVGLSGVHRATVPDYGVGVLWINGRIDHVLSPGVHAFWRFNRDVEVQVADLRLQTMEVSGQEILTRDKVALRINLAATWRLTVCTHLAAPSDQLYRELQFGLRAAVGTRTLDELLENKQVIDEIVVARVRERLSPYGVTIESAGVKDIVLPGEMKTILAQVVEAGKSAEANVIRRREETAATRSLLNTAKVMEDNPVALRLKELETLERVAERIDRISVFGGLDQVLNGLVKLR